MKPEPAVAKRKGESVEASRPRARPTSARLSGIDATETISSSNTFLVKAGYAVVWFGFWSIMGAVLVAKLLHGDARQAVIESIVFAAVMLLLGYFLISRVVWTLADEVIDGGAWLEVRRGSVREVIDLAQIMRVTYTPIVRRLYRVSLQLRTPCAFGTVIRFVPRRNASWLGRDEVASDLAARIELLHQEKLAAYREQALRAAAASRNGT